MAFINLQNSTMSNNRAADSGGGLNLITQFNTALVSFVTITENPADWDHSISAGGNGGGISNNHISGNLTIFGSIIANNSDKDFSNPDCYGSISSTGGNLFGIGDSSA